MGEEMLLGGAAIVPRKLLETGYTFRWPTLSDALRAMLRPA
jgi:NAD dependent epimerase/dehydratase family enzyme